jgi:hypothetical protein
MKGYDEAIKLSKETIKGLKADISERKIYLLKAQSDYEISKSKLEHERESFMAFDKELLGISKKKKSKMLESQKAGIDLQHRILEFDGLKAKSEQARISLKKLVAANPWIAEHEGYLIF